METKIIDKKRIIVALRWLHCFVFGHKWQAWEDSKYISAQERLCERCRLHEQATYMHSKEITTYSWARGSNWKKATFFRK